MQQTRRLWRKVVPRSVRTAIRAPLGNGSQAQAPTSPDRRGPGNPNGLKRLHAGCGPKNLMGDWWNVDIRGFPGIDQVVDLTEPWPWNDLEYVFGEHFIEHLPLDGAIRFLSEAAAALRPGGQIRLSTPGLEWVWRTHFDPSAPDLERRSSTYGANRAFYGWGHQFLYSRPMLDHVLEGAGFGDISYHEFGESDHPELRGLERHGSFERVDSWPNVWIVEATPTGVSSLPQLLAEADEKLERYRRQGH